MKNIVPMHEAAHAFVCWHLGGSIREINLPGRFCRTRQPRPSTRAELLDYLAVCLAGIAFELVLTAGESTAIDAAKGDLANADEAAAAFYQGDEVEAQRAIDDGFGKALEIVRQHMEQILALAAMVERIGRLPGANAERYLHGLQRLRAKEARGPAKPGTAETGSASAGKSPRRGSSRQVGTHIGQTGPADGLMKARV